jgi:hypothetical protein
MAGTDPTLPCFSSLSPPYGTLYARTHAAGRVALADWAENLPWSEQEGKRKVVEFFRLMRFALEMGEQLAGLNALELHQFFSLSPNWGWSFEHGHGGDGGAAGGGALCLRTLAQLVYFLRAERYTPVRAPGDDGLPRPDGLDALLTDDDRRVLLGSFPAALANAPRKWAEVSVDVSRWLDGQMPLLTGKPSKTAAMNWARRYLKQRRAYLLKRLAGGGTGSDGGGGPADALEGGMPSPKRARMLHPGLDGLAP